jgi:hypothetical protein
MLGKRVPIVLLAAIGPVRVRSFLSYAAVVLE